jgi:hypothetical protein
MHLHDFVANACSLFSQSAARAHCAQFNPETTFPIWVSTVPTKAGWLLSAQTGSGVAAAAKVRSRCAKRKLRFQVSEFRFLPHAGQDTADTR